MGDGGEVDKRAIELGLGDRTAALTDLRWIAVDEVSRTGGRQYFTIVTDFASGRVVWIGDGKGRRGMLPFLRALGAGASQAPGCGQRPGLPRDHRARLAHAVHILDRFHIVQWVNRALDQLRRRLFSAAPRDALGRTLKVKKWLLLSAHENLAGSDRRLLHKLMQGNEPLYQGHLLKEQLRAILRHPWKYFGVLRARLQEWILAVFDAALPEFKIVADRLTRPSRRGDRRPSARRAARAGRVTQQPDRRVALPSPRLSRSGVLQAQDPPALRHAAQSLGEDRALTARSARGIERSPILATSGGRNDMPELYPSHRKRTATIGLDHRPAAVTPPTSAAIHRSNCSRLAWTTQTPIHRPVSTQAPRTIRCRIRPMPQM